MLASLFDMFVQGPTSEGRRNSGLGVGLSVVKRLVELHGGSVRALSDGATGSEFIVDLPIGSPPQATNGDGGSAQTTASAPARILVIDDNTDAADALALLLTIDGHEVETRPDGVSGIAAAARYRPDVVLLDIALPDVDGYEVARQLRESTLGRYVTLIAVTGYGLPSDRIRSAEAGFDHHITKPVNPKELARLISTRVNTGNGAGDS
jgi:two-component system CheB/CheR fusion protein